MDFKKSFFGGYNKAAVDAFIEERNEKIDNLKERESTLTDTIAHKNSEIAKLSLELEKMKLEAEKINAENSALKTEVNKSHLIFENVAKIYERAYEAGHNIVLDSKTHSDQMIDHMNRLFYAASNNVSETIAKQDNLKQELTSLYAKTNSIINELTNNTNALFKSAEEYSVVFEVLENIKASTDEHVETHLKEFKEFASEFLTTEEIEKDSNVAVISDDVVPSLTEDEQITSPITESDEAVNPVIYDVKDDIVSEANENSFSKQEETDQADFSHEEEAEDEISDATVQEEIATPTDMKASAKEVITPVVKSQEADNTATIENSKAREFTQFGRKSRVSLESREELIRKALLKNGGI